MEVDGNEDGSTNLHCFISCISLNPLKMFSRNIFQMAFQIILQELRSHLPSLPSVAENTYTKFGLLNLKKSWVRVGPTMHVTIPAYHFMSLHNLYRIRVPAIWPSLVFVYSGCRRFRPICQHQQHMSYVIFSSLDGSSCKRLADTVPHSSKSMPRLAQ